VRGGAPAAVAVLAAALGCSTGSSVRGGAWSNVPPSPEELAGSSVIVLPIGSVTLPDEVVAVAGDSVRPSLIVYGGSQLALALQSGGVVGRALAPGEPGGVAGWLDDEAVKEAYDALDRLEPLDESGGGLDPAGREAFETLAFTAGPRLVLAPRRLEVEQIDLLQWRARLLAYLVDTDAGRVVWRAETVSEEHLPPAGRSPDLLVEMLERATRSAAQATARRLRGGDERGAPDRLGGGGP